MNNTQFFTLGQVEKEFRLSKSTLSKDRASGKFTAEKNADGSYRVSLSELIRAYGDRLQRRTGGTGANNTLSERLETPPTTDGTPVLRVRLDAAERLVDELRGQRDKWQQQAERLSTLLTDQRRQSAPAPPESLPPAQEAAGGLFGRAWSILRGKG